MKLFAATVAATRIRTDERPEVAVQNMVMLLTGDDDDAATALKNQALQVYPVDDGWGDHNTVYTEIEQGMLFGPYRFTWQTEAAA